MGEWHLAFNTLWNAVFDGWELVDKDGQQDPLELWNTFYTQLQEDTLSLL